MQLFDIAAIAGAATASALAAVVWILKQRTTPTPPEQTSEPDVGQSVSLLFENEDLNHATEMASKHYQLVPGRDDWSSMLEKLLSRFPNIPETHSEVQPGKTTLSAKDIEDTASLVIVREGGFTRVEMREDGPQTVAQSERFKALQQEVDDLRRASETTLHAVWQVNSEGAVTWFNSAYRNLYKRLHLSDPDENKPVFELSSEFDPTTGRQRVSSFLPDEKHKDWYDVRAVSLEDVTVFHAVDVNALVKSEVAQRNFVQTLAKTFAQLSIGLAIFDRNGQLALFNPALIDLTALPADFLSGRPTLMSFFDRIRENRRMPEPKNYHSWRQQITEVIAAATDGRYQETWTLETGQTYRVNGRPHPDGAIAFLIEDISAEISLTRNFRAELELGQSLMDTFEEALAVFSSTGVLTFCNLAYRDMWHMDPDNSFADVTIADCVKVWEKNCTSGAPWGTVTDFVLDFGERTSWELPASLVCGAGLKCTVSRITSGATIVRFVKSGPAGEIVKTPQADTVSL
ncbi:MAG: PAS-domain containing protein [Roseobacter sp.]